MRGIDAYTGGRKCDIAPAALLRVHITLEGALLLPECLFRIGVYSIVASLLCTDRGAVGYPYPLRCTRFFRWSTNTVVSSIEYSNICHINIVTTGLDYENEYELWEEINTKRTIEKLAIKLLTY